MSILVTGGAGFIGSALCRRLIREGHAPLTVVDKLTYAASPKTLEKEQASGALELVEADICDTDAMDTVFKRTQPTLVFNLAAETHVDRSIDGPEAFLKTNTLGVLRLLEVMRSHRDTLAPDARDTLRLIHISTDEVFGALGAEGVFTEQSPYDPSSPYAASKAASDHLVRAWTRTYGLNTVITNCSNNYGPYQFPEKLIPLMILKALAGERLPVYGDGQQVRDWLHVDDHADALIKAATLGEPGATYAIGGRAERTNLQVVHGICAALDAAQPASSSYSGLIQHVTDRPGHDRRYAIAPDYIEQSLGWRARKPFETGLAETVDWYLDNEAWWRPILERRYAGQRLGAAV